MEMIVDPKLLEQRLRKHDEEWHAAIAKLKEAAKEPLGVADRIRNDPLPWIAGGLLIGFWIGVRRG